MSEILTWVRGTATDAETGEPLIGAHAFIGASQMGTVTDTSGFFEINRIPEGTQTLWISMIGYEPESQKFFIGDTTQFTFDLVLKPSVIEMGEVTVSARKNKRWRKRLATFEKLFLDPTGTSETVKITNPEVLDFKANWLGKFSAHAAAPLFIENRELGYQVKYVLKEFRREGITIKYDGDPFFEELTPANEEEAEQWKSNRINAYLGSFKHFLISLLEDKTKEEGFQVMYIPTLEDIHNTNRRFRIDPNELLEPGPKHGDKLLSFAGVVEITYTHEMESEAYRKWHEIGRAHV